MHPSDEQEVQFAKVERFDRRKKKRFGTAFLLDEFGKPTKTRVFFHMNNSGQIQIRNGKLRLINKKGCHKYPSPNEHIALTVVEKKRGPAARYWCPREKVVNFQKSQRYKQRRQQRKRSFSPA